MVDKDWEYALLVFQTRPLDPLSHINHLAKTTEISPLAKELDGPWHMLWDTTKVKGSYYFKLLIYYVAPYLTYMNHTKAS